MSKSLYESLLRGKPSTGPGALLAAFATAAATVRAEQEAGLAHAEFIEGAWVPEDADFWMDADLDDLALAARDSADLEFPVRYRGGGRTVLLGMEEEGGTYAVLEEGTGPVVVLGVSLTLGQEVSVVLDAPPGFLTLEDGSVLTP